MRSFVNANVSSFKIASFIPVFVALFAHNFTLHINSTSNPVVNMVSPVTLTFTEQRAGWTPSQPSQIVFNYTLVNGLPGVPTQTSGMLLFATRTSPPLHTGMFYSIARLTVPPTLNVSQFTAVQTNTTYLIDSPYYGCTCGCVMDPLCS
jgi:hypothetical protein